MDTMWAIQGSQRDRPHPKPFFDFDIHRISKSTDAKKKKRCATSVGLRGEGMVGGGR